ncbi:aspartic peptidase domain-containing protein [Sordaria brevicollis]|uniref:Probable aspartic-type endopeptidase OPSB n=1 Tax=Sordaria brevicollis TaxID=83679 RepID=A0AAE0P9T6_SORBR|nr:aspartic peptidase domain-containing protein [Sordaria brevicollis]
MKGCTSPALVFGLVLPQLGLAQKILDGVVQWNIQKRHASTIPNRLPRRAGSTYDAILRNERLQGGYYTDCEMGTPGQKVTLQLDTGSSDIWVPDSATSVCEDNGCQFGSFDPGSSSTFKLVGKDQFSINYVDKSGANGDYFTDVFKIGGVAVKNLTMGLGVDTDIPQGVAGIGYPNNEATANGYGKYPNLAVSMADEGLIKSMAYSLWLNDLDASQGSILFGGIDTKKYKGDLTRIKIYPAVNGEYFAFIVALTSLHAVSSSGNDTLTSKSFPIPVVLDSGTTLSYLPQDIVQQVWYEVGADYDDRFGMAVLPCSKQKTDGYFSFGFAGPNGPRINVRMDELVLDLTTGSPPKFTSGRYKGQEMCEFGIQTLGSSDGPFLLGDTFLRSAYVVYDLVNNEIALAETQFNSTGSNVVAFASMGAPIPSATQAPNQAAVTMKPEVTTPAYSASDGFGDDGDENASSGMPSAFGLAQMSVMGVAMLFTMIGSGVFVVL